MPATTTITELRGMPLQDLRKEIRAQESVVRKLRLQITMNTEKDSARYRRERKHLARLLTVLSEKGRTELKDAPKAATVSRPRASKAKKAAKAS